MHFVENIKYGFSIDGDERRKTALNVKIEKLLFLFSWQNIFIAFSSATIFPFRWNMMFKCLLYFFTQPLIKTFHFHPYRSSCLLCLRLNSVELCCNELYSKATFGRKQSNERIEKMMEIKVFVTFKQRRRMRMFFGRMHIYSKLSFLSF